MLKVEIIPNDNPKEREDGRGRVRVSHKRTWVLLVNGSYEGEYRRRKDAGCAAARLQEKHFYTDEG